jgi:flagellar biosynthesis protein FlhB
MAEESFQEKTEKATPRRREEVRRKGEVAKSRELPSAAVLLSGALALFAMGSFTYGEVAGITKEDSLFFRRPGRRIGRAAFAAGGMCSHLPSGPEPPSRRCLRDRPAANLAQVGFIFAPESDQTEVFQSEPLKGFREAFLEAVLDGTRQVPSEASHHRHRGRGSIRK